MYNMHFFVETYPHATVAGKDDWQVIVLIGGEPCRAYLGTLFGALAYVAREEASPNPLWG